MDTGPSETPRWVQRYDNFLKAKGNLADAVGEFRQRRISVLEQAGFIQLFEIAWELGWKVLSDNLLYQGLIDDVRSLGLKLAAFRRALPHGRASRRC